MKLEERYRAYLFRKLAAEDTISGRTNAASYEIGKWILPSVLALIICWVFSLNGWEALAVALPAVIIQIAGIFYVSWVRVIHLRDWRRRSGETDEIAKDLP